MFNKEALLFIAIGFGHAFAAPLVERDFTTGTCKVQIIEDAWPGDADTSQPFWLQSNVFDGAGSKTASYDWHHCDVVGGHQRCQFKSGLKDDMILDPMKDGNNVYVQVNVGGANFRTSDGNCQMTNDSPGLDYSRPFAPSVQTQAHREWECTFACW